MIYWLIISSMAVSLTQEPRVACEALANSSATLQGGILHERTRVVQLEVDSNVCCDETYYGPVCLHPCSARPGLRVIREVRSCTHVPERRRTEPQPPREVVENEEWRLEP